MISIHVTTSTTSIANILIIIRLNTDIALRLSIDLALHQRKKILCPKICINSCPLRNPYSPFVNDKTPINPFFDLPLSTSNIFVYSPYTDLYPSISRFLYNNNHITTSTMPQHPPPYPSPKPTYNPHISKTMPWTCCRCRYTQSTYVVTCNGCRHSSCRGCIYHSREFARCAASTGDVDVMNHTDTVDSATTILEIAEKACFANASLS